MINTCVRENKAAGLDREEVKLSHLGQKRHVDQSLAVKHPERGYDLGGGGSPAEAIPEEG